MVGLSTGGRAKQGDPDTDPPCRHASMRSHTSAIAPPLPSWPFLPLGVGCPRSPPRPCSPSRTRLRGGGQPPREAPPSRAFSSAGRLARLDFPAPLTSYVPPSGAGKVEDSERRGRGKEGRPGATARARRPRFGVTASSLFFPSRSPSHPMPRACVRTQRPFPAVAPERGRPAAHAPFGRPGHHL